MDDDEHIDIRLHIAALEATLDTIWHNACPDCARALHPCSDACPGCELDRLRAARAEAS